MLLRFVLLQESAGVGKIQRHAIDHQFKISCVCGYGEDTLHGVTVCAKLVGNQSDVCHSAL